MNFEANLSILYSDTLLPDVFITEYLPSMDGDCLKIYIYIIFLSKHNRNVSTEELSKILNIETQKTKEWLFNLENLGLITWKDTKVIINDSKEREITKLYRLKNNSTPEEAIHSSERNKRRSSVINSINSTFFQGVMAPSWYLDIDMWFDRYKFDEDVMMYLFRHCYDHNGLSKAYITKVADSWACKNIVTAFDLEKHLEEYQLFTDIRSKIVKKLNLKRYLSQYEEEYIEKWVMDYKYDFDIIEIALKKTTSKTNPNFKWLHSVISDWFGRSLLTKADILNYDTNKRTEIVKLDEKTAKAKKAVGFDQRTYSDEFYDSLYEVGENKFTTT